MLIICYLVLGMEVLIVNVDCTISISFHVISFLGSYNFVSLVTCTSHLTNHNQGQDQQKKVIGI